MPDVKVKIFTQGGDEHEIETPLDIKAEDFIKELVTALKLPTTDAENNAISWRVDDKDTGKTLEPQKTLEQNGVMGGHRMSLIRQVVAGCQISTMTNRYGNIP